MNMNQNVLLKDLNIAIIGGQIMSRVVAKDEENEMVITKKRVIIPKAILSTGLVDNSILPVEALKAEVDEKRITQVDDIVIKLSPPFDAAIIDKHSADCVVPSFCAIIKSNDSLDLSYLLAFLNSSLCKEQLKQQVAGSVMTVLSVGKIANVSIPMLPQCQQKEIGTAYKKTQHKLHIINQIVELETKRNDILFKELVSDNG